MYLLVTTSLCSVKVASGIKGRLSTHTLTPRSNELTTLAICVGRLGLHLTRDTGAIVCI